MRGRLRLLGVWAALLGVLLAGCATFPDQGPPTWRQKLEGVGELGGPPSVPRSDVPAPTPSPQAGPSGTPQAPSGCVDPDPQVVATCLEPVGAVAVLPDGDSALVGERATGRVLRVRRGAAPQLVTTVPVDASGGGGLTGLVLSPAYTEDQLVYAYVTTPSDNRVVKIAPGEPAKPVFTGIPRGPVHNAGALAVDVDGSLLVATGDAGAAPAPGSLAGKVLRIDTLGHPAPGNPDPASAVLSSGITDPGGMCVDAQRTAVWITDHIAGSDVLHLLTPGALGPPAWRWPDRPGAAGCTAADGVLMIAETGARAVYVLTQGTGTEFVGTPDTQLVDRYGRLSAAALGPDGLVWLGTVNKAGGNPVPSDDRVVRIQVVGSAGQSKA